MLLGDAGPYEVALPGGELDRDEMPPCSRIGDGIDVGKIGERPPVEEPEDIEVVLFRRLLPWLSWW